MTCPRCEGIGLVRTQIRVTGLYGTPRVLPASKRCPCCGGTGKVKALPPMWWQDKDDDQPNHGGAE